MSHHSISNAEQLTSGVTFEWILDKKAFLFTTYDSARDTVDAWMSRLVDIAREWPMYQPVLMIVDATDPDVTQTPYLRARLKEIRLIRPQLSWYIAFVPPQNYVMNLMQMSAQLLSTHDHQIRIFNERTKAIDWLASHIA